MQDQKVPQETPMHFGCVESGLVAKTISVWHTSPEQLLLVCYSDVSAGKELQRATRGAAIRTDRNSGAARLRLLGCPRLGLAPNPCRLH